MTERIVWADLPAEVFPFRLTFLRDGVVLTTMVVSGAGVLTIPAYGPCVALYEFADGTCMAVAP